MALEHGQGAPQVIQDNLPGLRCILAGLRGRAGSCAQGREGISSAGSDMPQWVAGYLKNREKARLKGGRCAEAPMIPGVKFVAGLREAKTGSCAQGREGISSEGVVISQRAAGHVKNREKARLEGENCARAQFTRSNDGKKCLQRKHDARKHGEIVKNAR